MYNQVKRYLYFCSLVSVFRFLFCIFLCRLVRCIDCNFVDSFKFLKQIICQYCVFLSILSGFVEVIGNSLVLGFYTVSHNPFFNRSQMVQIGKKCNERCCGKGLWAFGWAVGQNNVRYYYLI